MELLLPSVVFISLCISYLTKKFLTLSRVGSAVGILVGFIVILQYTTNNTLSIDPTLRIVSGIIGLIIIVIVAIIFIIIPYLRSQNTESRIQPQLKYVEEIRVKIRDDFTFDKKFHYSTYYLTIKNAADGIEAKECKGKITVSDTDIEKRQMLWESGKPSIAIGHEELLRLFEISETSERKTILFHRNRLEYDKDMDGKKISVKIQSENAICPSDAYESTVGDVIKNAS